MAFVDEYRDALVRRLSMIREVEHDQAEHDAITSLLQAADKEGR